MTPRQKRLSVLLGIGALLLALIAAGAIYERRPQFFPFVVLQSGGVRFKLMWNLDQAACLKSCAQYAFHWWFARLSRKANMCSALAGFHQAPGRFRRCWTM